MLPTRLQGRAAPLRWTLPALALLAACDLPTSAPRWNTTWNVPAQTTTISVASLLPAGVTIAPDSSAFRMTVPSVAVARTLGQDCASCAAANGATIPKPAFTVSVSDSVAIPSGVASAALAAGDTLVLTVDNGYSFDPIRPSAAGATGSLVVTVTNGGTTIGSLVVSGATSTVPAGARSTFKVPLSGSVAGSARVRVTITVDSPAGDPATMNSNASFAVTASAGNLAVASAAVSVTSQSVNAAASTVDLSGVTSDVSKRVQGGALILDVANPFGVAGTVTVTLAASGTSVVKSFPLTAAATSAARVDFTSSELDALLGQSVDLRIAGSVSAPGGTVTITPKQHVSVGSHLEMTLSTSTGGK